MPGGRSKNGKFYLVSVMGGTNNKRWFDQDVPRINRRVLIDYLIAG